MEYLKNRIQTIQVGNNETKVEMPYENICIRNIGENTVYASINSNVIPFADGVLEIKSGEYKVLRDCYKINEGEATCFVYSDNESQIEVESANDVNFFNRAVAKGGGGDTPTDTYTKDQIDSKLLTKVNKQDGYGLSQNDFTNELKNSYDSKLETVELIYNGSKIYLNDEIKLFEDIRELCTNHIYFVYLTYNSTLYIPVFVNSSEIYFDSVVMRSGETTIKRIAITYQETVTTNEMVLEQSSRKVTSIDNTSTDIQYPSAKLVYNELQDKVGKADYPSNSKTGSSGVVKTDPNFGIYTSQADYGDVTKGLIYVNKATTAEINAGTNNYKPIVPSNLSVAMSKYGIDNNTIANMNVEIDGKVDNDVFVADNMIKFPYYSDSDSEFVRGIKRTINSDGSVTFNGISTANTTNFYCVYEQQIKSGTYTLSGVPNIDGLQLRFNIVGVTNYDLNGGTESLTFTIESDATFNLYPRATKADVVCNNAVFYPMLEKGSVAHDYQPYKLSRQSLRDDIDAIQTDVADIQADVDIKIDDVLNLIPYPYTDNDGNKREETYSENGLTFNFSKNGILVNGTNEHTGNTNVTFCSNILLKANKTYTLSGCGNKSRTRIRIGRTSGGAALYEATYNNPITFTPTQDELCNIYISIGNGEVLNNILYVPTLEYGDTAHEFEEYQSGGIKDIIRNLIADIDAIKSSLNTTIGG